MSWSGQVLVQSTDVPMGLLIQVGFMVNNKKSLPAWKAVLESIKEINDLNSYVHCHWIIKNQITVEKCELRE